jgi:hypothetical protein
MKENRMAPAHLLAPTTFDMKSMNPSIVTPKPRGFNTKGNANRAAKVKMRFFQLISEDENAGRSFFSSFFRAGRMKLTNEKKARSDAARKGRRPEPGLEKVPREAWTEENSIAAAKTRKKRPLF